MPPIMMRLQERSTGFSHFERDQVLTHEQLNTVADYADDQVRLDRVKLSGVGILHGLHASLVDSIITVSPGIGVTTDGDLLDIALPTRCTRYRPYDSSRPTYPAFYRLPGPPGPPQDMRTVYELLDDDATGADVQPLAQFQANTQTQLTNMVVVLFVETHLHDTDLCSGTDCDNLGQALVQPVRLLILSREDAAALRSTIPTPREAASGAPVLSLGQPSLQSATNTPSELAGLYRAVCRPVYAAVPAALGAVYNAVSPYIRAFATSPVPSWTARMSTAAAELERRVAGVQYHYDFLQDLLETYDEILIAMLDDDAWLHDDLTPFPKHLLLTDLGNPDDPDWHTPFHPTVHPRIIADGRARVEALMRRLDAMINAFSSQASDEGAIRVTPSKGYEQRLGERAIPIYYDLSASAELASWWDPASTRRNRNDRTLSYHARQYSRLNAVTDPLGSPHRQYPFLRVEGHFGQDVERVRGRLEALVRTHNLPIHLRFVLLDPDARRIRIRPPRIASDLLKFHDVLRKDLMLQLDEVVAYSERFEQRVRTSEYLPTEPAVPTDNSNVSYRAYATQSTAEVAGFAAEARNVLSQPYTTFSTGGNDQWQAPVAGVMDKVAQIKVNLSPVLKTDFTTPFDRFLGASHFRWLDWIDLGLKGQDEQREQRSRFGPFVDLHPGLEHLAGVVKGGTLVLVYDQDGVVVADFSAPGCLCEVEVEPDAEVAPPPGGDTVPTLPPLVYEPPKLIRRSPPDWGINVVRPPIDEFKFWTDPMFEAQNIRFANLDDRLNETLVVENRLLQVESRVEVLDATRPTAEQVRAQVQAGVEPLVAGFGVVARATEVQNETWNRTINNNGLTLGITAERPSLDVNDLLNYDIAVADLRGQKLAQMKKRATQPGAALPAEQIAEAERDVERDAVKLAGALAKTKETVLPGTTAYANVARLGALVDALSPEAQGRVGVAIARIATDNASMARALATFKRS